MKEHEIERENRIKKWRETNGETIERKLGFLEMKMERTNMGRNIFSQNVGVVGLRE